MIVTIEVLLLNKAHHLEKTDISVTLELSNSLGVENGDRHRGDPWDREPVPIFQASLRLNRRRDT
ncbi:MAG: hypothetical protein EWM72_01154 [Nitrospira sp.]|nr:MAG: hypothetical protein EWM72_01154 [Nitrospira sp.]